MCTHATNRVGKMSLQNCQILENLLEISRFPSPILRFPSPKSNFPHTKSNFPHRLSNFLQRLSAFFNSFPIFFDGFPLSKKSEKIYPQQQVYKRSLFELCISCHLLPELRNSCYNVYIYPTPSPKKNLFGFHQR